MKDRDLKQIRRSVKQLWIDIFGDSRHYVDMVVDHYFDPEYCKCVWEGEKLIAMAMAIPYNFIPIDADRNKTHKTAFKKGLYLCGLSTLPEYRKRGIMASLMKEIEELALTDGFDFTFLIPADDRLRDYYRNKGYYNSNSICDIRIVANDTSDNYDDLKITKYHEVSSELIKNKFSSISDKCTDTHQLKNDSDDVLIISNNNLEFKEKIFQSNIFEYCSKNEFDFYYEILQISSFNIKRNSINDNKERYGISTSCIKENSTKNTTELIDVEIEQILRNYKSQKSKYLISHNACQITDIFEDCLSEEGEVIIFGSSHFNIFLTYPSGLIIPIVGSVSDTLENLNWIIKYKCEKSKKLCVRFYIREVAEFFINAFDKNKSVFKFLVQEKYYGMIKNLGIGDVDLLPDEEVSFGLMLD